MTDTVNPYLVGNYGPVAEEVTAFDLKLAGEAGNMLREHAAAIGVRLAASHTDAVRSATLIISAVTASQAVPVAAAIAPLPESIQTLAGFA